MTHYRHNGTRLRKSGGTAKAESCCCDYSTYNCEDCGCCCFSDDATADVTVSIPGYESGATTDCADNPVSYGHPPADWCAFGSFSGTFAYVPGTCAFQGTFDVCPSGDYPDRVITLSYSCPTEGGGTWWWWAPPSPGGWTLSSPGQSGFLHSMSGGIAEGTCNSTSASASLTFCFSIFIYPYSYSNKFTGSMSVTVNNNKCCRCVDENGSCVKTSDGAATTDDICGPTQDDNCPV